MAIPVLIKRNTLLLAASQAFVGTANQMMPAFGALMVVQLLGSPVLAGLTTGIQGGCRFLVAYPAGYLADAFGRRIVLLVGLLLCLVGSLSIGFTLASGSFALFVVALVVFGLGVGAAQQLRLAAADLYPASRRAEGLGYVLMGSLVGAVGAPLLVKLAHALSPQVAVEPIVLVWFLAPLILLPSIAMVAMIRPDPRDIAANLAAYYPGLEVAPPARPATSARIGLLSILWRYPERVGFVASFAVQGNMSMNMALTSLALAAHGHELAEISVAMSIHAIGMFGLSLPIGRLTDRVGRRNVMLVGVVIALLGSCLVSVASAYAAITAGTFLVGLGWSCVSVAVVALLADTTGPLERGRVVGANDTFGGIASIALALLAGPVVALAGLPAVAVVSAILMAPPLVMLLQLREPSPGKYASAAVPVVANR